METPPSAPPHQFQAQNAQYPPPPDSAQYGPVLHQSQPPSQTPAATLPPEPKPTTAQPPKERTRHSSACFPCAKRKVKCDRDVKNPCSNCLKRDQGHLCEVKSHKDRITHHRVSDPGARDVHRDKRPKFEVCQVTSYRSTAYASLALNQLSSTPCCYEDKARSNSLNSSTRSTRPIRLMPPYRSRRLRYLGGTTWLSAEAHLTVAKHMLTDDAAPGVSKHLQVQSRLQQWRLRAYVRR